MEIQLEQLIDQIKKDGVEAAESEAEAILNKAKAKAEKIVADANAKAKKIMDDAAAQNERTVKSGEEAIRQAGRNLLISFRESVAKQLEAVVGENVTAAYSKENLASLIINVVSAWANKSQTDDLEVILNTDDLKSLEDTLLAGLKEKMLSGVTLKANDNFDKGFRIGVNNGTAYFDYSADAVVEMLSNYLSPKVTELLKEAE